MPETHCSYMMWMCSISEPAFMSNMRKFGRCTWCAGFQPLLIGLTLPACMCQAGADGLLPWQGFDCVVVADKYIADQRSQKLVKKPGYTATIVLHQRFTENY